MIIKEWKYVKNDECYILLCKSNSEIQYLNYLHSKDLDTDYFLMTWSIEDTGAQIIDNSIYKQYIVVKRYLDEFRNRYKKNSSIESFINHILYFQNLKESE